MAGAPPPAPGVGAPPIAIEPAVAGKNDANHQRFLRGSIMGHVIVMTLSGAVGLVAVFLVDLLNLAYIAWLKDDSKTAAVGFATNILFFAVSFGVGIMIAATALVSRAIGAGRHERSRQLATSSMIVMALATLALSCLMFVLARPLLQMIGAQGEALNHGVRYLRIVVSATMPLCLGIGFSGILRAVGDAKRSMYITLSSAVVAAILDPIVILGLGWGLDGAAGVAWVSRLAIFLVGLYYVMHVHDMLAPVQWRKLPGDTLEVLRIALPVVLTNIATPVAVFILTRYVAAYGDSAIAGSAIIDRIVPISMATLFVLSASISPIIGQNFGGGYFDRVRQTLHDAVRFTFCYTLVIWAVLFAAQDLFLVMFQARGLAAELVTFFCTWMAPSFGFLGLLFAGNSAFNTMGYPLFSTAVNWSRALLGVWPLIAIGGYFFGPRGLLIGFGIASVLAGLTGLLLGIRLVNALARHRDTAPPLGYWDIILNRPRATRAPYLAAPHGK